MLILYITSGHVRHMKVQEFSLLNALRKAVKVKWPGQQYSAAIFFCFFFDDELPNPQPGASNEFPSRIQPMTGLCH